MNLSRSLFGRGHRPDEEPPETTEESLGFGVIDLLSDEERQIQREAHAGESLGEEIDNLVAELVEIGHTDGFLSRRPGDKFDENCKNIRVREIGTTLDELGGYKLMLAVCYRILATPELDEGRRLESAWGYIGKWQP